MAGMYDSHIPEGVPMEDAHLFSTFTLDGDIHDIPPVPQPEHPMMEISRDYFDNGTMALNYELPNNPTRYNKENTGNVSTDQALMPPPKKVSRVGLTANTKGVKKIRAPIMAADRKFLGRHLRNNIKQLTTTKKGLMETIPGNSTLVQTTPQVQNKNIKMVSIINQVSIHRKINK